MIHQMGISALPGSNIKISIKHATPISSYAKKKMVDDGFDKECGVLQDHVAPNTNTHVNNKTFNDHGE
eukprot:CAMPEP_0118677086 /NCGR_PEP_ID=MMETSP0800-20121206/2422_1 /TAXON_ID=210618 ORGANISM="Striatella unipunctata, Strain CCMP2910" /NCGR_SAMPLE_ID=MMETSP0800 /ASSEMBLY_ACC=CAM_ASM_000638 /LENGTH=67 /DNA_ID=CAMNT_0006572701 /DNA_START=369 /DNA_END=572 /DNA_ORIENTATION=+